MFTHLCYWKHQKVFWPFLSSTFVKIHQNWFIWRILPVKKKDDISLHISGKEIFEEKKRSDSCYAHFDHIYIWNFFSIGPIWMIFMEGRVNTCYCLDFENFLQKKGKKGLYAYFGTLAIFVTLDTKLCKVPKCP
jgi:hypothetical protein